MEEERKTKQKTKKHAKKLVLPTTRDNYYCEKERKRQERVTVGKKG